MILCFSIGKIKQNSIHFDLIMYGASFILCLFQKFECGFMKLANYRLFTNIFL